jgi:polysaccharide export outer membrane protein
MVSSPLGGRLTRAAITALLVLAGPSVLRAQVPQRPSQAQAEELLRTRPDLLERVRSEIMRSGMTPAQVRARLRAEGYSENLLDAYLGSSTTARTTTLVPEALDAVRALGIIDDQDADSLYAAAGFTRTTARDRARQRAPIDTLAPRDSTLSLDSERIFGLDLFESATDQFRPNAEGPVDAGYRLGPGDELVLILTGEVEAAHTLPVTREGFIVIPDVGQVAVANLTMAQAEELLYSRLRAVYSGVRRGANAPVRFSLSASRLRSVQVFVTGDVVAPGAQRVSAAGTVLTALYAAGGPSEQGSFRAIQVRRGGAVVAELDLYDYLLRGDASKDVRLQQGDIVFVPVHGPHVRVDGEITRPATYELKPGESLQTVIAAAGGLTARAGGRRVLIERILPIAERAPGSADRVVVDVPIGADGALPTLAMAAGDLVRVGAVPRAVRNRIQLQGHVWSPGAQGFTPGLTLSEALARAGGPKPDAYLGRVLVARLRADSTRAQLRVALVDSLGATAQPFALAESDVITVFSRTEFRPEQYVAIGGAVRKGGRYPYREGMTLRDLVLLAGGVDQSAYLREAEIARLPVERSPMATASTIRVPIDSSFLFDRITGATSAGDEAVLRPFDNVLILRDPNWNTPASVLLTGEVRFPGRYTLRTRDERLAALVSRAGGLTSLADPRATFFSRLTTSSDERTQLDSLTARADSLRFARQPNRIRVGLDLERALRRPNSTDDLLLIDGDSLHIAPQQQTVEVRGEVNSPTALTYTGRRLGFYLSAAGGPSPSAIERRAYVIQPNGKVESRSRILWLFNVDPKPQPGATVIVPAKDPNRQPPNLAAGVGLAAQVIASIAAILVLAR